MFLSLCLLGIPQGQGLGENVHDETDKASMQKPVQVVEWWNPT